MYIAASEIISYSLTVLSVAWAIFERRRRKTQGEAVLGFLHGMKPSIESAARNNPIPPSTWKGTVDQINDVLEILQPAKKQ